MNHSDQSVFIFSIFFIRTQGKDENIEEMSKENFQNIMMHRTLSHSISSWLRRTQRATLRLNSGNISLHSLAASTLAGLWSLGSASIEMTEIIIVSTVWMGNHLSQAFSYPHLSSPGSWSMDIHTSPFFSTIRH